MSQLHRTRSFLEAQLEEADDEREEAAVLRERLEEAIAKREKAEGETRKIQEEVMNTNIKSGLVDLPVPPFNHATLLDDSSSNWSI